MEESSEGRKTQDKRKIRNKGQEGEEGIEWIERDPCYITALKKLFSEGVVEEDVFPEIPLSENGCLNNSAQECPASYFVDERLGPR